MSASLQLRAARSWLLFAAEGGVSSVASVISIILMARFIPPEDFGLFALAIAIVQVANTFVELLFQDAVVQRPDLTHDHERTAFTCSLALGVVAYLACFAAAWPLAGLFGDPRFVWVFLATALTLPINGAATVSIARLRRGFRFDPITISYAIGRLGGAALGPILAILGWGVWALVIQHLLFVAVYAATGLALESPRYRLGISRARLRELAPVALPRLALAIVRDGQIRLFTAALGVLLDVRSVGYVGMSIRLVDAFLALFQERYYKISVSLFAVHQHDREQLQAAYRDAMGMFLLMAVPMLAGITATAPTMVPVILGETWRPIVPIVQVLGFVALWQVAIYNMDSLAVALGRPLITAKFFVLCLVTMVVTIAVIQPVTPLAAIAAWNAPLFLLMPIWVRAIIGLTGWSARDIFEPIAAPFLCGTLMAILVWWLGEALSGQLRPTLLLASQVGAGAVIYGALSAVLNRPAVRLLWRAVRPPVPDAGIST
jgi:O-antigen/teichoic acid export membrane protein